jgi:hypothetical protein
MALQHEFLAVKTRSEEVRLKKNPEIFSGRSIILSKNLQQRQDHPLGTFQQLSLDEKYHGRRYIRRCILRQN